MSIHEKIFLTDGYWTCPADVFRVEVEGCGGGAGGGSGAQGGTADTHFSSGGGGGGSALLQRRVGTVVPGVQYYVFVGAGGAGATDVSGSGDQGSSGGTTYLRIPPSSTIVAQFNGAQGGMGGDLGTSDTAYKVAPGGSPTDQRLPPTTAGSWASVGQLVSYAFGPGFGGEGVADQGVQVVRRGVTSIEGFAGGAGGAFGAFSTNPGGGAGGGGAGGPYGVGGVGGTGGAGSAGAGSAAASAGTSASANTGAGGGGGAGGGSGSSGGVGSVGGAGGSGKLIIRWYT